MKDSVVINQALMQIRKILIDNDLIGGVVLGKGKFHARTLIYANEQQPLEEFVTTVDGIAEIERNLRNLGEIKQLCRHLSDDATLMSSEFGKKHRVFSGEESPHPRKGQVVDLNPYNYRTYKESVEKETIIASIESDAPTRANPNVEI